MCLRRFAVKGMNTVFGIKRSKKWEFKLVIARRPKADVAIPHSGAECAKHYCFPGCGVSFAGVLYIYRRRLPRQCAHWLAMTGKR